jgi:hypothetical protein
MRYRRSVRFGSFCDISAALADVCSWGNSRHRQRLEEAVTAGPSSGTPDLKALRGQEHAERALNNLARTFLSQMETAGEQKVTVQHVTVSDNAQAIVGNVSTGSGGDKKG